MNRLESAEKLIAGMNAAEKGQLLLRILKNLGNVSPGRLHNQGKHHKGIFACKYDPDFVRLAKKIDDVLRKTAMLSGVLVRINRG
jgi:hypothetical protein